ncbi:MAG TPA: UDP-glucuronic acid decarboxylase family protein [Acidobacteriaceae bacterium]|nr:UDP-glucuronic acid decarboxylase family protein [Acidobacteriaceae bacterium]
METKRILVTGAAGFLGSHLCDALLGEGHELVGVDNLATGSLANLKHLEREPRFSLEQLDICEPFDVGRVEYVFNFASPASPVDYMRLGIETLQVGSAGTLNTLELAKRHGAGYLHASTSECYGDPEVHPQVESYWGRVNPVGPRSVYDEAKRFSEAAVSAYHRYHGVNTHLVRIFNTYGPRLQANDGRVISNLMMQALRGEPLTVYGDGSQTRSFCYVSDLIDGIVRLSKADEHGPVNIGNPAEWTILECAQEVRSLVGARSEIVFKPLPRDDPKQRQPDITRAKALLGWEPKVGLREGLERSLAYFKAAVAAETEEHRRMVAEQQKEYFRLATQR